MNAQCKTKEVLFTVQENGIIRRPTDGLLVGSLHNDVSFYELEHHVDWEESANHYTPRKQLQAKDERIKELEESLMVIKHGSVMRDAELEAASERIKELEETINIQHKAMVSAEKRGHDKAMEAAEAKVKSMQVVVDAAKRWKEWVGDIVRADNEPVIRLFDAIDKLEDRDE